jgi:rod shape-determining protein MreC
VVLSIGLITADRRFHHMEAVRTVLSTLTYPLVFVASLPARSFEWVSGALVSRRQLEARSASLHEENLTLRARLQQLEALEAENMRLRDLLGSSFKIGDRVLIAELISVDLDPYRQQVVINKGSGSGAFVGQPVLDANAVMGQVVRVTPRTATVLLITDAAHALPVQVNRNGLRTIAEGTGFINTLQLPHLPNNADIREGDLLVTSGLGGHFPPGYPVARVSSVRREPGKPFATVTATPSAHLERAREVLLVWTLTLTPPEPRTAGPDADPREGRAP